MSRRFDELDSVRGLAALSVMRWHFSIIFPLITADTYDRSGNRWLNLLKYTPLHFFFAGREAVITFFILSGFVLSIPFYWDRRPSYRDFVIKRVCRIYVPYIVAVAVGFILVLTVSRGDIPSLSSWVNGVWRSGLTPGLVVGHISLIFPLLMIVVLRLDWRASVAGGFALSVVSIVLNHVSTHSLHYVNDYFLTLEYVILFVVGALLCRRGRCFCTRRYWQSL